MADPQIPTADSVVGPGIDKLIALRPNSLKHINYGTGRYSHIFAGVRAQVATMLKRLADEAKSARLKLAEGQSLKDLAASEYDTVVNNEAQFALADVTLTRSTGPLSAGMIRKGTRFRRPADSSSQPLIKQEVLYTALADVVVLQAVTPLQVLLQAQRSGAFGN